MRPDLAKQPIDTAKVEDAIRQHPSVGDCVVLSLPRGSREHSLIAYVVTIGRFLPEVLESYLRSCLPVELIPEGIVPVSRIPLTPEGEIDAQSLMSLPVFDSDVIQQCEDGLRQSLDSEDVAVVVCDVVDESPPIHLSDVIPNWKSRSAEAIADAPLIRRDVPNIQKAVPAICEGEALRTSIAATCLADVLVNAATSFPNHGITYVHFDGSEIVQSYQQLLEEARRICGGLTKLGIQPQHKILFQVERNQDFIPAFWGCVLGGFVPIPLAVPSSRDRENAAVKKLQNAWQMLGRPIVMAGGAEASNITKLLAIVDSTQPQVVSIDEMRKSDARLTSHAAKPDDAALILLTSGSTGVPKGVIQSHRAILSRTAGTVEADGLHSQDVSLNWFPLDHVGGLVMFHIRDVYTGSNQVQVPINYIIEQPLRWLDLIDRHRATATWAPNFAYGLINALHEEVSRRKWDLTSLRFILNGGEAIVAKTARRFLQLLAQHGLPGIAMRPAWGMSETCSGVTSSHNFAVDTTLDDDAFVEVGAPLPGVTLRIVDDQNRIMDEGANGALQIKGEMVTSGYFQNPEQDREAFTEDGWFITGDLATLRDGRLTITGRQKDVIIVNGINIHSHEIESLVEDVPGVEPSFTAACAVRAPGSNTDELVVFFNAEYGSDEQLAALVNEIRGRVVSQLGVSPTYVVPVSREAIPKSEIGKIQRAHLRTRFQFGKFDSILKQVDIATGNANTLPNWFFRTVWQRKEARRVQSAKPQTTLIFEDELNLGASLNARLERPNATVISVIPGQAFTRLGQGRFQIDPRNPKHYCDLLQTLLEEGNRPDSMFHLWTYAARESKATECDELEYELDRGVFSILFLTKALAALNEQPVQLVVVSSSSQAIHKSDDLVCARSAIRGLLDAASAEMPGVECRHVDLPIDDAKANAAHVITEMRSTGDREVAYRGSLRMIPLLARIDPAIDVNKQPPIRHGGTYVITGGLGGIGFDVAKHLLEHLEARVLVIGKTALQPGNTVSTQRMESLRSLEKLGEVRYQVADVTVLSQLRTAFERGLTEWGGQVDGVFHLAGTYHDRSMLDETRDSIAEILKPKMHGALALQELVKDQPGCLFVNFSSAVSFFGGAMIGAYSAANRFLDSLSQYQNGYTSLKSVSVSWTSWTDVGMSRGHHGKDALRARGIQDIPTGKGINSLLAALNLGRPHVFVGLDGGNRNIRNHLAEQSTQVQELCAFVESSHQLQVERQLGLRDCVGNRITCKVTPVRQMPRTESGAIDRKRLIDSATRSHQKARTAVAPRTDTERQLVEIWKELLGSQSIGIEDNFFQLGGHSLLAMQVISRVRAKIGVDLSQQSLFEAPTIAALAELIIKKRVSEPNQRPQLTRARRDRELPLSFAQQRLWIIDQLEAAAASYNTPIAFSLKGSLNVEALRFSLNEIVRRHESLRTNFVAINGQPTQVVTEARIQEMPVFDLTHLLHADRQNEAMRIADEEAQRRFDLSRDALLRTTLIRLDDQHHWLVVTFHHIVCDGWSLKVFRDELANLYAARCAGDTTQLTELPIQFPDYAVWQREWLRDDVLNSQREYWKNQLQGAPALIELPTDRPRPPAQSYRGSHVNFSLSRELSDKITRLSKTKGNTLFMTLMAAFQSLLVKLCGQGEVVTGTAIANRSQFETESLIGCLINVLLIRTHVNEDSTFRDMLQQVCEAASQAFAHQDLPFERLVEDLRPQRDLSHNPLTQTMFVLLNEPIHQLALSGLHVDGVDLEDAATQYDLMLHMWQSDGVLAGMLHYSTDLFDRTTIERYLGHFERFLEAVTESPAQLVRDVEVQSPDELKTVLVDWNNTAATYPTGVCIHQLFEQQVEKTPEAIAAVFGDEQITYAQLNRQANQLAHYLRSRNVGHNALIALCVDRSLDMMVGLLGILKAGAAYVPLDPAYPRDRLAFMLEDAGVALILTHENLAEALPKSKATSVRLDADWPEIAKEQSGNLTEASDSESLAYVIYTSGSTGHPKGVEIPHRAVVNFLSSMRRKPGMSAKDRLLAVTTLSFDIAGLELFLPLTVGATVVIASREVAADGARLISELKQCNATIVQATPSTWRLLLDAGWPGDQRLKALCGGEALPRGLANQLVNRCASLWNMYGPTETTIWSTVERMTDGDEPVLIGKPIDNTQVYIVDSRMGSVPVGVAGELLIGGDGLARGYRNRPELTAEKFVNNPFDPVTSPRLYRTGDLARWRSDGTIECLGRLDHQVKIRGHRIELGEIESALGSYSGVREVVVVAREEVAGDKRLVAYLVVESLVPGVGELHRFLKEKLPDSMIPSAFVILDALPRTPNGKIDRKSLPAPSLDRPNLEQQFAPPATATEIKLANIWQQVLQLERIGIHDNFFELGGQSLLATQVSWRIKDTFGTDFPLRAIFEAPTVAGLSERLDGIGQTNEVYVIPPLVPVSRDIELPLSFAQQRFWFVDQLATSDTSYNLLTAHDIDGPLIVDALKQSLRDVVSRHEALRTCFPSVGGQPHQTLLSADKIELDVVSLSALPPSERRAAAVARAREEIREQFDLSTGPLLRTILFELGSNQHILVVVVHHIISDAWSLSLFGQELAECYAAHIVGRSLDLDPLPIQYADYAVWQRNWLQGEVLQSQLNYWSEQLAGVPRLLELPTDRPRPPIQSFRGGRKDFSLPRELSDALKALSRSEGSTLFMTLMAAFQVFLSRYSSQESFIVSTGVSNRDRRETVGLIGCLINILLLRADVTGNPTFRSLLTRVREIALGAFSHQDLPFERLVEELEPQRDLSYNPLTQVMFVMLNESMGTLELENVSVRSIEIEADASPYDLVMHLWETPEGLSGFWHYSSDLFDDATIERMLGHFEVLLASIVAQPNGRVLDLPLLSPSEVLQIVGDWNETTKEFPQHLCLHQLFELQVERNSDAIAVIFGCEHLTYAELNHRANQLANYLRACSVGPDVLVGLCVERSLEMVIGILGIMKAGGAYVPLDPSYPLERLDFMLRDTNAPVLLTQKHMVSRLSSIPARVVCLDAEWPDIARESSELPASLVTSQHLAYVIFTSGSTGQPKGIALRHQGVVNNIVDLNWRHGVGPSDRMLALSSLSFDMCVYEIFGTLEAGGAIVMPHPDELREPAKWAELIGKHQVTIWNSAPALLKMLVDYTENRPELWPRSLRLTILGGDWVPVTLPDRLKAMAPSVRVIVLGGATEASIHSIIYPVQETDPSWTSIPYGTPQYNQKSYILNSRHQPQPIGVAGELYLGGIGLARGYYGRPALTADRFIPNPFSAEPGQRIYTTGDLARYRPDGVIELIGRVDYQVKIRGMRIECGEIEACLRQHPAVREAVVAAKEFGGDKRLVAYIRPDVNVASSACRILEMEKDGLPSGWQRSELPNEMPVVCRSKAEIEFSFREIFEENGYLRHGIEVNDGDCIFDVGANIGLFAMSIASHCAKPTIYAFEPIPPVFDLLRANSNIHGLDARLFNCGLSRVPGNETLTYYPHLSLLSGRFADERAERNTVRTFLSNEHRTETNGELLEELLEERMQTQSVACEMKTLSQVIEEQGVQTIDLLKIDVEKGELDVLAGIASSDWPKIKQLVVEVYDKDGRADWVTQLLERNGFKVVREQDSAMDETPYCNLFAVRNHQSQHSSTTNGTVRQVTSGTKWSSPERLVADLRLHVKDKLPEYMVPFTFVLLSELPLSPNGKTDRKALPTPDADRARTQIPASRPTTAGEAMLASIWASILEVGEIGTDENFFDLGGHSLLATQVISQIREAFQIELPLRALFESPTVGALAKQIEQAQQDGARKTEPLVPVPRTVSLPLSFAQERLWFIDQLLPGSASYNIPLAYRMRGALQTDALRAGLSEVVRRHEPLRTSFPLAGDRPRQNISAPNSFDVAFVDLSQTTDDNREMEARRLADVEAQRPFDLAQGPLFRATLIRLAEDDHILLLTLHHSIADGWSLSILTEELSAVYSAFVAGTQAALAELPLQYADYSVWQRRWLQGNVLDEQLGFWKRQLAGAPLTLELPTDRPRPAAQTLRGARYFFSLPRSLGQHCIQLARESGATPFMALLAAFKVYLHALTARTDILIGSPFANRTRAETEGLIGPFVNTVVLRTRLDNNPTYRELLGRVRDSVLAADAHQEVPFEKIVETIRPPRDPSRNPVFQVNFRVVMSPLRPLRLAGIAAQLSVAPTINAKFDLAQELWISDDEFGGYFEYCTDLFDESTVKGMADDFEKLLTEVLALPESALSELSAVREIEARLERPKSTGRPAADSAGGLRSVRRKAVSLNDGNEATQPRDVQD